METVPFSYSEGQVVGGEQLEGMPDAALMDETMDVLSGHPRLEAKKLPEDTPAELERKRKAALDAAAAATEAARRASNPSEVNDSGGR